MSTLRLSSTGNNVGSIESYMQRLSDDTSISISQKNDCLKTLTVVLKNLIDSKKGCMAREAGLKYRTLKLENPKIKAKLFCSNDSYVKDLLTDDKLVGMKFKEETIVMEDSPSQTIQDIIGLRVLPAVNTTQSKIAQKINDATTVNDCNSNKKAKLFAGADLINNHTPKPMEKLSEKQKARRIMEEKKRIEKEKEKLYRERTRAQIAADKIVRETDENWKPSVSAAADKIGTGLQSFRDRHGEEE